MWILAKFKNFGNLIRRIKVSDVYSALAIFTSRHLLVSYVVDFDFPSSVICWARKWAQYSVGELESICRLVCRLACNYRFSIVEH